jgi:dipeptidyl aminopeptidase/acylaminoacyl peptidase
VERRVAGDGTRATGGLRPMTPSVVRRQVVLEDHDVLPDGSAAIVVRRSTHADTYRSHLWRVELAGERAAIRGRGAGHAGAARRGIGPARALTHGAVRDTVAQVSPDGTRVAFLRSWPDEPDRPTAILVLDLAGGEPWTLVAPPHGASDPAWAPDGRRIAYAAESDPPRFIVGREVKGTSPTARRIARIDWRWDDVGYLDRWAHLWVVAVREGAAPRRLTQGDWGVRQPAWAPDGRHIAFTADRGPEPDLHPRPSIHAVAVAGGEPREILSLAGYAGSPAWSPDGRLIACIGADVPEPFDDVMPGVFVGPADGSRPAEALAPDLDLPVGAAHDTDLNGWSSDSRPGPAWAGPDMVVALVCERGRTVPWGHPVDPATGRPSGPARPLTLRDGEPATADAACWTIRAAAGVVSVLGTLDARPQELMTVDADGPLAVRTSIGSAWRRGLVVPEMRRFDAPGDGGPIECWLASPPGAGDAPLPTVVDIHGGPLGAWAPAPSIEVHLLVSRGYRVLLPNIRGSTSYGAAWILPQLGDWGGVDAADVHAAVDDVVAAGLADPARLGVLGLSYGGFMVNWLVATSDRFRAAVSENGVTNQVSTWANSDSGPEYCRAARMGDPLSPDGVELLWRQSPLAHVADIRTPLLLLQAEADRRCPLPDAEQMFVALRLLGREVEMIVYPDEYHVYAMTGRPDRRIDRMTRMLDWFDAHMGG